MKKFTCGFLTKLLAFVLCLICLLSAIAGTVGLIAMNEANILHIPETTLRFNTLSHLLYSEADDIVREVLYNENGAAGTYNIAASNLRYFVKFDGYVIDSNYNHAESLGTRINLNYRLMDQFSPSYSDPGIQKLEKRNLSQSAFLRDIEVSVDLYLLHSLPHHDIFRTVDNAVHLLCVVRPHLGWIIAGGLVLGLLLAVYLFHAAGRRPAQEGIVPNLLDRIPADLYLALCTGLGVLLIGFVILFWENFIFSPKLRPVWLIPAGLSLFAFSTVVLGFFLSIATRIKLRTLWKNTVIWYILSFLGRSLRRLWQGLRFVVRSLPVIWRTVIVLGAVLLADFLITIFLIGTLHEEDLEIAYWLLRAALLTITVIVVALNLRTVRQGCRDLAGGKLDTRVDTSRLIGDFKAAGEDVNNIGQGMAKAVEERMKSERMKTELITNVSHDIKTPLTSIINYVDLIKKEQPESPALLEYVTVLDRQAIRLKKLLEDLLDASKASTGALSNTPEPCELGVMLQQTVGEFTEKLTAAGLTPVVEHPEAPVYILADGRHLARVFDNLLNNACKYSQPGTRLYLSLKESGGKAVVTLRNISREALNVAGDELMERFVRGDRSRHTEGSGLGLSIARSLVELQGGTMKIVVDGDLFKVSLVFPTVPAPQPEPKAESVPEQPVYEAAVKTICAPAVEAVSTVRTLQDTPVAAPRAKIIADTPKPDAEPTEAVPVEKEAAMTFSGTEI